jgi:hypothetical protein
MIKNDMNISKKREVGSTYRVSIAFPCDLEKVDYDPESHSVQLLDRATVPPLLARYCEENGHVMPDGLYGFFGDSAELSLKSNVQDRLPLTKQGRAPIWDLSGNLEFDWLTEVRPSSASLVWKNVDNLKVAFLRIGRCSGETNDLLRFFTGDRRALDRLTLEPWRIDSYVAALEQHHGILRAVIFDAMMADGSIQAMVKVYDPSAVVGGELQPLYRFHSSVDPNQATSYSLPEPSWSGWEIPSKALSAIDVADITSFVSQPKTRKRSIEALITRRIKMLREEDRFRPRDADVKAISKRRVQSSIPESIKDLQQRGDSVGTKKVLVDTRNQEALPSVR